MLPNKNAFKFPIYDADGQPIRLENVWGKMGFSDSYRGELVESDELVQAIRSAIDSDEDPSRIQQDLIRSFSVAWLSGQRKNLGAVLPVAIELPPSIKYIDQIGSLGRTAQKIVNGSVAVATTILLLDFTWDTVYCDMHEMSGAEVAGILFGNVAAEIAFELILPDEILNKIDSTFGLPSEPNPATAFDSAPVRSFLQLCQFRNALMSGLANDTVLDQLLNRLEQRIFALFLVNSRQIEGLSICGTSEASAAVLAHASLALGMTENSDSNEIIERIQESIDRLDDAARKVEANQTLAAIRQNLNGKAVEIERRINRHAAASMTTEAIDLATFPVSMTFELLGSIAGGLGKLSANTKAEGVFSVAEKSFKTASTTVDATPNALSYFIQGGLTVEEWTRKIASQAWSLGKRNGNS